MADDINHRFDHTYVLSGPASIRVFGTIRICTNASNSYEPAMLEV